MKKILVLILIIGAVAGGYITFRKYAPKQTQTFTAAPTVSAEEVRATDIEKRMIEVKQRPDHRAKVEKYDNNEARRVATEEYEKEEKAKYEKIQADIKASKDLVKSSEVSF